MALRLILLDAQAAWSWVGTWRRPPPGKRTGQGKEQRGADDIASARIVGVAKDVSCVRRLEPGLLLPVQAVLLALKFGRKGLYVPLAGCARFCLWVCVMYACVRERATKRQEEKSARPLFLSFVLSCPISWGARQSLTKQRASGGYITIHQPGPCSRPANK